MPRDPEPPAEPRDSVPHASLNRKAMLSVAFGLAAFGLSFVSGFAGFVLAVPAVTSGIHARREIVEAKGDEAGDLLAVAGLTMGATTLGLLLISAVLSSTLLP